MVVRPEKGNGMAKKLKELDYHEAADRVVLQERALKFSNKVRTELGLPPIDALVPGAIEEPGRCTLNRTIVAEGLFPFVDYEYVQIIKPDYASTYDQDGSDFLDSPTKREVLKAFKVPVEVKEFLRGFDAGYFPELVTD